MLDMLEDWIIEADIKSMQTAMDSGKIRSQDLINVYLNRIQRYSVLNTVIEINPDAVEIAISLDKERAEREAVGHYTVFPYY